VATPPISLASYPVQKLSESLGDYIFRCKQSCRTWSRTRPKFDHGISV